jgi:hypothetical protein
MFSHLFFFPFISFRLLLRQVYLGGFFIGGRIPREKTFSLRSCGCLFNFYTFFYLVAKWV